MHQLTQIQQMCDDIYALTGIKAVFYDADMQILYNHPGSMGAFCACLRKEKGITEHCIQCDRAGFAQCRKTGELTIYQCHMGLTEAVSPVIDNETVIGYILFGQLVSQDAKTDIEARLRASNFQNRELLLQYLQEIPPTTDSIIKASARLMSMCASNIHLKTILKIRRAGLPARIDAYISQQLGNPSLSINTICREFGISRGTLYGISKSTFGMGITDYIRSKRLHRAIQLIRMDNLPIYRIAEELGFSDANYMAKLIKKETGSSPKQLQKQNRQ